MTKGDFLGLVYLKLGTPAGSAMTVVQAAVAVRNELAALGDFVDGGAPGAAAVVGERIEAGKRFLLKADGSEAPAP